MRWERKRSVEVEDEVGAGVPVEDKLSERGIGVDVDEVGREDEMAVDFNFATRLTDREFDRADVVEIIFDTDIIAQKREGVGERDGALILLVAGIDDNRSGAGGRESSRVESVDAVRHGEGEAVIAIGQMKQRERVDVTGVEREREGCVDRERVDDVACHAGAECHEGVE